ncbi:hypothetical protein ACGFZ7_07320 [Pseudomonas sp. NPDC047963]|nr:hypothetical protein [Pseudomonas sp.]
MIRPIATSIPNEAAGYTAMTRRASIGFIYVVAVLFITVALALVYLCMALAGPYAGQCVLKQRPE